MHIIYLCIDFFKENMIEDGNKETLIEITIWSIYTIFLVPTSICFCVSINGNGMALKRESINGMNEERKT